MKLTDFSYIVLGNNDISIHKADMEKIGGSYSFLREFARDRVVYGINTGFGPMAQYRVDDDRLSELQYNIIRSHSCGAGEPLPELYVRAAMVARLQTFVQARSGVHPDLPMLLARFVNEGIYPVIPRHGSVGASGDLVQLAHMALALIGEGEVFYKGVRRPGGEVLAELGIEPLKMYIREGLAVTNGTAVMTGVGLVNLIRARRLLEWSVGASVMMNEIASSYDDLMAPELNEAKLHDGQRTIAAWMRRLSEGSACLKRRGENLYSGNNGERIFKHKVQPYYSLRCVPQILGPVLDTLRNAEKVLVDELNSADDNPIVDAESGNVYHGGNFHGDYVSLEMDKIKIAVTKMTMLAERQLNYLMHDRINEVLPPFVNLGVIGLNYGMQAAQFTATSTTAECQTLSNPMYVHSIPNNNDNQDIVSMGTNSALIAGTVIENGFQVAAIHFMALAQAVDCLSAREKLAPATQRVYDRIRELVPAFSDDAPKYKEIEAIVEFLMDGEPPVAVE